MKKRKPLTNKEGEVRELTYEDFKHFKPASEFFSKEFFAKPPKRGRPKSENAKRLQSFKLSPDVIEAIKATGPGYNVRVEAALRRALKEGRL